MKGKEKSRTNVTTFTLHQFGFPSVNLILHCQANR